MAFIEKKDPTVLNIKLTSKGREQLSKGKLTFKYYAVGDSEIDYDFIRNAEFDPINSNILRPVDKNPKQLSFILKNPESDPYIEIPTVPSTDTTITNEVQPLGFFNDDATEFLTDTNHVKQPDIAIPVSGVTGGTWLKIQRSPTYQGNYNEPKIGDILLIKWTNPLGIHTTGYIINKTYPTPYLWYKINDIIDGTLYGNNLIVKVDRELPDYSNITNGDNSILAGGILFYKDSGNDDIEYATDNANNALLAFLQNCQCPTVTFPFWNMSIIFTKNIAGINFNNNDKEYYDYNNRGFAGFISYIQNQEKDDENYREILGVIHYTNNSVSNTYGEGFYGDPMNPQEEFTIPTLDIPTIMWHKSNEPTLGLQLKASGELKQLTSGKRYLNAEYYDLADPIGNVVGKVFYDLQIFLIEDQELLFAMSYKSNRSWTLPKHNIDTNANVSFGCDECLLNYNVDVISPSTINGDDGKIIIYDITNSSLNDPLTQLILRIKDNNNNSIYINEINGETTITKDDVMNNTLYADDYVVELIDTGFANCVISSNITIPEITSDLSIFDKNETYSKLNSYFNINPETDSPTHIKLNKSLIGDPFGIAYATITSTGTTNSELNNRTESTNDNDILNSWVKIPDNNSINITNLTFKEPYQIFVRDSADAPIDQEFNSIISGDSTTNLRIESQIWSYYVAAGNPLNTAQDISVTRGSDSNGDYIAVSNYIDPNQNDNSNPVIGDIEISIYKSTELPNEWYEMSNDGDVKKYYLDNMTSGTYNITIREKYNFITMYSVTLNSEFTI